MLYWRQANTSEVEKIKKEEKTLQTRERILAAARKEFGEKGYAGASLNAICGTGIPKGLLYHNFENKDAVYLACVRQCFSQLTQQLRENGGMGDIRRYMEIRQQYFQEHPEDAGLFFEVLLQPPQSLTEEIAEIREEFDRFNQESYRLLLSRVVLRPGVSETEAMEYFALMQAMYNGYFSSPAYQRLPLQQRILAHEDGIFRLMDFMLYGVAEKSEKKL